MGFLERFRIGSRKVGIDLVQLEAEKFKLEEASDVNNMLERTEELGASLGLGEKTRARASIQGSNAARGSLNEKVTGLKI